MNTIYIIGGLMLTSGLAFAYIVHRIMKAQVDAQKALAKAAMEKAEAIEKDNEFTRQVEMAAKARKFENQKKREAEMAEIDKGNRDVFNQRKF